MENFFKGLKHDSNINFVIDKENGKVAYLNKNFKLELTIIEENRIKINIDPDINHDNDLKCLNGTCLYNNETLKFFNIKYDQYYIDIGESLLADIRNLMEIFDKCFEYDVTVFYNQDK